MKNQSTHARLRVGLILALVGLISAATLVLSPARLASAQAAAPSWTSTGNLNTTRSGHTATLLPNGKVLVTGGASNTAELYDQATETWSSTGNLHTTRIAHTATLLSNGKVLVVAGVGDDGRGDGFAGTLGSAELYDPATGTWSNTGRLNFSRDGHTATLLPNGKVLVAGGSVQIGDFSGGSTSSAELYDPATGTWSNTGNLNVDRAGHTATLLPNGKVLVAAGSAFSGDDSNGLNSAELYNPATGTWSSTGNLNAIRNYYSDGPTATLLSNGKVLVAGGYGSDSYLNSAELYDPVTGTWSSTGSFNTARADHTATLLRNGRVLVAGGIDNCPQCFDLNSAELYDPATGTWGNTASLNTARQGGTATLLSNGKVLVAGGDGNGLNTALNSAELYDPGTSPVPNQIDDAQFFVRQHYRDFLNREPDPDGLVFWTNEITLCGADQGCIEAKRIKVSAAFFLSIEFQETGYLVYRLYKSSYSNLPGAPVPITLNEFLSDTQQIGQGVIVNQAGWETVLENNKQAFSAEFVQRSRFISAYPTSLRPDQFVDQLFLNAGVTPSATDRTAAINEFGSAATTADAAARARALRRVAENSTLTQQEFNRAFVLMQYFGYLRRNPNDPPELGLNFDGYNFWLTKLNQFNGDYSSTEMVKAFITSGEYRQRFGP